MLKIRVAHTKFLVLALVNIILNEIHIVIPNTSSMYIKVLCVAPLDKN